MELTAILADFKLEASLRVAAGHKGAAALLSDATKIPTVSAIIRLAQEKASIDEFLAQLPETSKDGFRELQSAKWNRLDKILSDADFTNEGDLQRNLKIAERAGQIKVFSLESERIADIPPRTWRAFFTTGMNLVIARKGIGKTLFIMQAAYSITAGKDFLGRPCAPASTLIIFSEIDRIALHERAQEYGPAPGGLDVAYEWRRGTEAMTDVEAAVLMHGYRVVIVDMLQGVLPLDLESNNYDAGHLFLDWRRLAQRLGICLVCTWHAVKAERDDFVSMAMGTTGLPAQSDVVLFLDRKRSKEEGKLFVGGNHAREEILSVRFENRRWSLSSTPIEPEKPEFTPSEAEIMKILSAAPNGLTAVRLAADVGRGEGSVRAWLSRLRSRGLVQKSGSYWFDANRNKAQQIENLAQISPVQPEKSATQRKRSYKERCAVALSEHRENEENIDPLVGIDEE